MKKGVKKSSSSLLTAVEDSHRPALSPEPCGQDEEKPKKQTSS
jgi:hypothetical protein